MANEQKAEENPFSMEKAWQTFVENRERAVSLRAAFEQGKAEGAPVREQLVRAVEGGGKLTDNTIFLRIVQRALESRDQA